jgi:hypothetical protein
VCWDAAPRLLGNAFVTVPGGAIQSTQPVYVLVHVGADGAAINAFPTANQGDDPAFMRVAVRHARAAQFQPATKAGRPVESWFRFRFAPQIQQ